MVAAGNHRITARSTRYVVFLPLALFASGAMAQPASNGDRIEYVFKSGDTLYELAEKYFRKRGDYLIVQRQNRIANPRKISIGKRVTIPFRLLKYRPTEASLSAFRGKVSIASDGQQLTPAKGLDIGEGSQIITAAGSFVTLSLEDGSRISMPSNSRVRITRLRHILLTDSVDYEFSVDNGRVRSKVVPFDRKQDRYRVRTPVAVSAVRGTDYRIRVDETSGTAYSETVEGSVDVAAGQDLGASNSVSVPAGQGAAATVTGELLTANLLDEPKLVDPAAVQSDPELRFEFQNATGQPGQIKGYRMLISSDAGFVDIIDEKNSAAAVMQLPAIPDGRYFGKASAVAENGFEGLPTTFSFKRVLSTIGGTAGQGDFGYRFKWAGEGKGKRLYRFQLVPGDKTALPMIDEAGLTEDVLTLSDLPDGDYFWRIGVTQFSGDPEDPEPVEKWTEFEKLTVAG